MKYVLNEAATPKDSLVGGPALSAPRQIGHDLPSTGAAAKSAALKINLALAFDSLANETSIGLPGGSDAVAELGQNEVRILGGKLVLAEKNRVTAPPVVVQRLDGYREFGANGVEVEVSNQLEQIRLILDQGVLEAILKKVPGAFVTTIEAVRVRAKQALHESGQREAAGSHKRVNMVGHEDPGVEGCPGLADEIP